MHVRPMTPADLAACAALTQEVKWPHRLADWQMMLALGEGLVAEHQGRIVGSTLYWRWGTQRATLGLIIVAGAMRGQGIGSVLLEQALQQLPGMTLHLHATAAGAPLYRRFGFAGKDEVVQYQTPRLSVLPPVTGTMQAATHDDLPALAQLDYRANGFQRLPLLQRLLADGASIILTRQQGIPSGFAVTRRFGHGFNIGPVIAPDAATAQQLIAQAMQPLTGEFVRIDSRRRCNLGAWLVGFGLEAVDTPLRMVRGEEWQPQEMTAWSLMSQAMG
ncbi:GNAT family N-acetyltransferase [Mixta intestinalis]|uniref:N-acetyltransferase domain-containing protein n=1 Tax=Mixta intestinalis TaxID=1615494 RepID=A0A6P1Q109_9GAMM|nr:GNAT family N-acetyltransferase [Mixta intestinalis]QHM71535.1 hypothetical protein C7M51_01824 [Mixta intestinalis]